MVYLRKRLKASKPLEEGFTGEHSLVTSPLQGKTMRLAPLGYIFIVLSSLSFGSALILHPEVIALIFVCGILWVFAKGVFSLSQALKELSDSRHY